MGGAIFDPLLYPQALHSAKGSAVQLILFEGLISECCTGNNCMREVLDLQEQLRQMRWMRIPQDPSESFPTPFCWSPGQAITSLAHVVCPLDTILQLSHLVAALCYSCAEGPSPSPLPFLSLHAPTPPCLYFQQETSIKFNQKCWFSWIGMRRSETAATPLWLAG